MKMKIIFVLEIICFFTVCVNASVIARNRRSDDSNNELMKYVNQCTIELGYPGLVDLGKYDTEKLIDIDQIGCTAACVYKKTGLINQDGTYNVEMFFPKSTNQTSEELKGIFDESIRNCTTEVENECKRANCAVQHLLKQYIEIIMDAISTSISDAITKAFTNTIITNIHSAQKDVEKIK